MIEISEAVTIEQVQKVFGIDGEMATKIQEIMETTFTPSETNGILGLIAAATPGASDLGGEMTKVVMQNVLSK